MTINTFSHTAYIVKVHYQLIAMFSIACLMTCILIYMLCYMLYKKSYEKKYVKWRIITDKLIQKAVFYWDEDEEETEKATTIPVTARAQKLMRNRHFRRLLTEEIQSAKKNITGTAADNLKQLYLQLGLDRYALKSLKSPLWHIKAKAIQELTLMEMKEYEKHLFPFTNYQNEFVRMEAQTAMVQFYGFEGLKFLDIISYPISDWQQIKLLQQLSLMPPADISFDGWFKSSNHSVVVFALKLARNYHRFDLHDSILSRLDHPSALVRQEAILCLREIYTDGTSDELIKRFLKEDIKNQLMMIKAMQHIGSERDVLFLLDLLDNENDEIKLSAARALAHNGKIGLESLERHAESGDATLNQMVMQIKGELAA